MFESHCIFISPIYYVSPKETNCGCLPKGLCISPHAGIGPLRESVKEHGINCKLKSYKLKLVGKFAVQQYLFAILTFNNAKSTLHELFTQGLLTCYISFGQQPVYLCNFYLESMTWSAGCQAILGLSVNFLCQCVGQLPTQPKGDESKVGLMARARVNHTCHVLCSIIKASHILATVFKGS